MSGVFCFRVVGSFGCACLLDLSVLAYAFAFVCCSVLHVCVDCMCVLRSCFLFVCLCVSVSLTFWLCMRLDLWIARLPFILQFCVLRACCAFVFLVRLFCLYACLASDWVRVCRRMLHGCVLYYACA